MRFKHFENAHFLYCKICYTSSLYVFVLLGTTPSSYNPCQCNKLLLQPL